MTADDQQYAAGVTVPSPGPYTAYPQGVEQDIGVNLRWSQPGGRSMQVIFADAKP